MRSGVAAFCVLVAAALVASQASCGRRHVSAAVDVYVRVVVVDASTGEPIIGAEAFASSSGGDAVHPEWREEQRLQHEDPHYWVLGRSGYGVGDEQGVVSLRLRLHTSWWEAPLGPKGPRACSVGEVWVGRAGYRSVTIHGQARRATLRHGRWVLYVDLGRVGLEKA